MTLPKETLATGASNICPDCHKKVTVTVMHSNAGYYIGSYCDCGSYSRESDYYEREEIAEAAFKSGDYGRPY